MIPIALVKAYPLTYSVVILVTSVFAGYLSANAQHPSNATKRVVLVQGFVLATDSCQLTPVNSQGVCSSVVVPINGQVSLGHLSTRKRSMASLNSSGIFTKRLRSGTYRVRLIDPQAGSVSLNRLEYRIYPRHIRIFARSSQDVDTATQANLFFVAHKSRGAPPLVGVVKN